MFCRVGYEAAEASSSIEPYLLSWDHGQFAFSLSRRLLSRFSGDLTSQQA